MEIEHIYSRMILDSRGYPTVEVDLRLHDGSVGRASAPSGASTGSREACELHDHTTLFAGKGVECVLGSIAFQIAPTLYGRAFASQREFDEQLISLDGTEDKSHLGSNALVPLSLAYAKAMSAHQGVPLYQYLRNSFEFQRPPSIPTPLINVLNGGKHAPYSTDFQEWMIVPLSGSTLKESLENSARVFYALRDMMRARGVSGVGDEGGFPLVGAKNNRDALSVLCNATVVAGLVPGHDIAFALDVAASEFNDEHGYHLTCDDLTLSSGGMIEYLASLAHDYPIVSIEDGLGENDWENWRTLTAKLGSGHQIVGDDLFVTNTKYIQRGIDERSATAVLIKPNQIGTLTETVSAIELAHTNGLATIISHRSGETEDTSIAHLAVACGAGQIKTGSLSRSERLAKYNELLRISESVPSYSKPFTPQG